MIIYNAENLGWYYRLNGEELEYAPMNADGTFDTDDFVPAEPSEEEVTFHGQKRTLDEVHEIVLALLRTHTV